MTLPPMLGDLLDRIPSFPVRGWSLYRDMERRSWIITLTLAEGRFIRKVFTDETLRHLPVDMQLTLDDLLLSQ